MPENFNLYNFFIFAGIFSTILYIIKLILFSFSGADSEIISDFDTITETDTSFDFLSIQSILAFFMGFGWSGAAVYKHFQAGLACVLAVIIGILFMFLSAYIMYSLKKLNKIIKVDYTKLEGTIGKAYTSFAPQGEGQIEIVLNNQLQILDAVNNSDEKIESFSPIKVVRTENNKIIIEKNREKE